MKELTTLDETPRFEEMSKVVDLYVRNINPTQIARDLGIRRVDVLAHIKDWKDSAVGSDLMKDRVEELISTMDQHYSQLIQKAYTIIDEVDEYAPTHRARHQYLSQKLGAIRAISDLEAKRIDVLQKSGLLEAADLGEELAEMEEQKELLLKVLEEELCDKCRRNVMGRLAGEMGDNTVVVMGG